jgi:hypothetical protein
MRRRSIRCWHCRRRPRRSTQFGAQPAVKTGASLQHVRPWIRHQPRLAWPWLIESGMAGLLVRLTRIRRLRAGVMLALLYLLCVMAPTIALASPGGGRAPGCLEMGASEISHIHSAGHLRANHHDGMREPAGMHVHFASANAVLAAMTPGGDRSPAHAPAGGACCELMCLTALPVTLVDIARPLTPPSLCDHAPAAAVADSAPVLHYRPPIS